MATQVSELMSRQPVRIAGSQSVADAARQMSDNDVGAVIIEDAGKVPGILTDRDIAVRVVAEGRDPATTAAADVCSRDLAKLSPEDDLQHAIDLMRERSVRRLLIVDPTDHALGVLSLGDLAMDRDSYSVLGRISAAPPNG
jgi:CBS domain-containing protein